jgi:hypothetical protein
MQHSNTIIILVSFLPACANQQVSYQRDITPILDKKCNVCHVAPHGYGYKVTGLKTDSYDSLMQGTIYGPVVLAGDSRRSILNKFVEGRAGKMQQNLHGEEAITSKEIETLKIWVDQGALNN